MISENTKRLSNVGSKLGLRLRRWPNIDPTLGNRLVCARIGFCYSVCKRQTTVTAHLNSDQLPLSAGKGENHVYPASQQTRDIEPMCV